MANPYVYSFVNATTESDVAKYIPLWAEISERFDGGATIPLDDTNTLGTVIPAGTPISVDKLGGTVELNGDTPLGYTEKDAIIGENGAPVDIVTRGKMYIDRCEATITSAQQAVLKDRFTYIQEV